MKKVLNFLLIIVFLAGVVTLNSCKKDEIPVVTTTAASGVTTTTAVSGGNVTDDGGAEVTARGVCWGTSANPTISGSKTTDGKGTGSFSTLPVLHLVRNTMCGHMPRIVSEPPTAMRLILRLRLWLALPLLPMRLRYSVIPLQQQAVMLLQPAETL